MSIRVLYIIDSLAAGGAERSLATLAPAYVSRGVHLDVAYFQERKGLQEQLRQAGSSVIALGGDRRIDRVRRARNLILKRQPDLVHTTLFEADITGRVAAALALTPVVSSIVNVSYGEEQSPHSYLRTAKFRGAQFLDAATAKLVARFHAVTDSVANVMSKRLKVPRARIDVVPRGRNSQELGPRTHRRRALARRALGAEPEDLVVLAAARHERQKGLDVLLDAFSLARRELPRARLFIAGRRGNQTALLEQTALRLSCDGQLTFLGSRDDVPDLLCACDAFILPSRWEGFPGALLEAMALDAPIVASDLPGVREAVGSEAAARLVPPDRPQDLATALVATLRDRDGSAVRARIARARFLERFTIDRVADAMVAFYDKALAQR